MKVAAEPNVIQTIGLALDVVGIVILFKYQIDFNRNIPDEPTDFAWRMSSQNPSAEAKRKYEHYVRMTYLGMGCILVGFVVQMVALWV